MERSTASVVLLPEEGDKEQLIAFSAMFNERIDGQIQFSSDQSPHITLGLMDASVSLPAVQLQHKPLFNRPFNNLRLAIGVNGEY